MKIIKKLLILVSTFATLCSCAKTTSTSQTQIDSDLNPNYRFTQEESTAAAISMLEYELSQHGFETGEAVASNGDLSFVGVVYSDYVDYVVGDDGNYYYEAGFLQIISDVDTAPFLLTPDLIVEDKPVIASDNYDNNYIITKTLPTLSSFSYVFDDWYNVVRRVGDFVVEINTYENEKRFYNNDISCFNYDTNKWLFKSDEDILAFNVEAIGLYSDYTKVYLEVIKMFEALIEMQNENSFVSQSTTLVVISGEILRDRAFGEQRGSINGFLLSDLLSAEEQLDSNQSLSITPNGVEVVTDATEQQSNMRIEKGIIALAVNALLIAGEVGIIVASWGTAGIPMAVCIVATVTASMSIIYGIFNSGEAISNIVYGSQQDLDSQAINWLRDGFVSIFGEDAGLIAYNIWGISNTIVSALACPIATVVTGGIKLGYTSLQIVGSVARYIGVKVIEVAATMIGSRISGLLAGFAVEALTKDELLAAYATDVVTLVSAIAIGIGLNVLDTKYDLSGMSKFQRINSIKGETKDEVYQTVKKELNIARDKAGETLKEQAAKDILNGGDPKKYGFDMTDPNDKAIVDFLLENGKFPSFQTSPNACEFAHAVDVNKIMQAVLEGRITLQEAIEAVSNPLNGMLTSHETHLYILHGGKYTNQTNYQYIINARPETESTILRILAMIGLL